jgi:hypothetical protein
MVTTGTGKRRAGATENAPTMPPHIPAQWMLPSRPTMNTAARLPALIDASWRQCRTARRNERGHTARDRLRMGMRGLFQLTSSGFHLTATL